MNAHTPSDSPRTSSAVVALFPGQGSQHVGMAKNLHDEFSLVRTLFEEASDAIRVNLKKLCFDGPESELTLTENTQPALLLSSVAAFKVAESEMGFTPSVCAGHSLGEYSALVAAGSLPFATAIQWVRERGLAMQRAVPAGEGTMAAILGMEEDAVARLCTEATARARSARQSAPNTAVALSVPAVCEPANFNAPGQVVIAGSRDGIESAMALLREDASFKGGKAIPLSVSAPFHCSLMKPARDRMAELFFSSGVKALTPRFAYVPNRTGRPSQEASLVFELLVEQVDHPVLWRQTIAGLLDRNFDAGIEFGPGKVLAGLTKRIEKAAGKSLPMLNVSDSQGLKILTAAWNTRNWSTK